MFTEQKLEQHYSSLPSETLHIIRDEYKWALETCGVHSEEQNQIHREDIKSER